MVSLAQPYYYNDLRLIFIRADFYLFKYLFKRNATCFKTTIFAFPLNSVEAFILGSLLWCIK